MEIPQWVGLQCPLLLEVDHLIVDHHFNHLTGNSYHWTSKIKFAIHIRVIILVRKKFLSANVCFGSGTWQTISLFRMACICRSPIMRPNISLFPQPLPSVSVGSVSSRNLQSQNPHEAYSGKHDPTLVSFVINKANYGMEINQIC